MKNILIIFYWAFVVITAILSIVWISDIRFPHPYSFIIPSSTLGIIYKIFLNIMINPTLCFAAK